MKLDDKALAERLAESATKLDGVEAGDPGFQFFRDMVDKQQKALRRTQRRQLALFTVVAAVLVSALIFCMGNFQLLFFVLQGAALMGAVAGLAFFFIKKPAAEVR
jgi:hypothetical protein